MNVMYRIAELLLDRLVGVIPAELPIFVNRSRDDTDVQALRALRLAVDIEGEAWLASLAQPLLAAYAVSLRLVDLLALVVEEHLVVEAFRRAPAEDPGDLARLDNAVDEVL